MVSRYISKRHGSKHKVYKHKVSKRHGSKHKVSKHRVSKHKVSKQKVSKHKVYKKRHLIQKGGNKSYKEKMDMYKKVLTIPNKESLPDIKGIKPSIFIDLKRDVDVQTYDDGFSKLITNCPIKIEELRKTLSRNIEDIHLKYGSSSPVLRKSIRNYLRMSDSASAIAEAKKINMPYINNIYGLRHLLADILDWHFGIPS